MQIDFGAFFEQSSSPWLVLNPDAPTFSVAFANDAYLRATGTDRARLLGQPVCEVSPLGHSAGAHGRELATCLERVLKSRQPETLAATAERQGSTGPRAGLDPRNLRAQNAVMLCPRGAVLYLSHRLEGMSQLAPPSPEARELERLLEERSARLAAAQHEIEALAHSVAHDLRAPLRAIDGFSEALATDHAANLDERAQHFLARIRAGAERMHLLLDALLGLARIHQAPLLRTSVDLSELSREVIAEIEAREPHRRVLVRIAPKMLVRADRALLRGLLEQLLGNAWKFTAPACSPSISISEERTGAEARYFISDNGVGFDMAYAERLFAPFQRLHSRPELGGAGMGLAIARRIVALHGGSISAQAEVGKGTRIFFTLGQEPPPSS